MATKSALALWAAAFCSPQVATAGTHWVSASGQAAWSDCAGTTPLGGASACSLATANANAVGGDTVYLRGGSYSGLVIEPSKGGTGEGSRVVFTNHSDEQVFVRDSSYGIYIYKKSYITVNGIRFANLRRFFRIYAGHHNTISHCSFDQRSADSGDWAGAIIADDFADTTSTSEDSTHNWVHHCSFYRWVYGAWDEHRGALLNLGDDQSAGDDSSYNLIEDNIFAYGGHHTLGVYSQYNVIRGNYIHNETNPANWSYEGYRGAITEGPSAGRCLYERNRFGFSLASGIALRSPNNIFRFNEFYNNGDGAIQVVTSLAGVDHADHNRIYNNSFFHNGFGATYAGFQGGMYFSSWSGVSPTGNVVKNNIFFGNKNGSISYDGKVEAQLVQNNWDENNVDPGFVDLSGTDPSDALLPSLRLKPDSSARNRGTWLTTITSAGGTGSSFMVADASYFTDGWGVVAGDLIQLAGQTATARITRVDYSSKTVTLDRSLAFASGQGVALAYAGAAPELGAFELPEGTVLDGGSIEEDGGLALADGGSVGGDGGLEDGIGGGCGCRAVGPGLPLLLLGFVVAKKARRRSPLYPAR